MQAGGIILSEHENSANLYTVLPGWALKYKSVEDGRRQVTNYGLPGDLLGLQASVFDAMHHSVEALTDVTLCILPDTSIRASLTSLRKGAACVLGHSAGAHRPLFFLRRFLTARPNY